MRHLRKQLLGAVVAGMLMTGAVASPTLADEHGSRDGNKDGRVNVLVYKDRRYDKDEKIERTHLPLKDAAKYAAKQCDMKGSTKWESLLDEAEQADQGGKAFACQRQKNKNTKHFVWFEDNHKKTKDEKYRNRHQHVTPETRNSSCSSWVRLMSGLRTNTILRQSRPVIGRPAPRVLVPPGWAWRQQLICPHSESWYEMPHHAHQRLREPRPHPRATTTSCGKGLLPTRHNN
jgi:hypothetical protein